MRSLLLTFLLTAPLALFAQPANDDCTGAIEIIPGIGCNPVAGDVADATESLPAITCTGITGTADDDVWYWFTATSNAHRIIVEGGSGFDAVVDVRTGACNGTNFRCADTAPTGGTEIVTSTSFTIGTVYYIRIYSRGATAPSTTDFTVCVRDAVAPENDNCTGAIVLVPDPTCITTSGSVALATQSIPAVNCNGNTGNANDDVWFSFTATETSHTIQLGVTTGFSPVIDVRSGACDGSPLACTDAAALLVVPGLTVGETYYVRIYHYFTTAPSNTSFTICVLGAAPSGCDADAGTLTADASPVCLTAGFADISATADGNAVVPPGYETIYALTQGASLLIVDAGVTPDFTVTSADDYTIHTLVYDPNTLDLGLIEIGVTTGFDVNALLIQGGGTICGSLDVAGASITVEDCVTCDALAGTITADASPVCLVSGAADISATPDGNTVVPVGYETVYVLTQGAGLVIQNAGAVPSFNVTAADDYTIHTLVYDPNTLDLGLIEIGVTTGFDVNALLIQGGGTICGSLDVAGAPITVQECVVCDANAGALTAVASPVCLIGGIASLEATPDGNAVVPPGYDLIYVLTSGPGLIIETVGATPEFSSTVAGDFTIHTLVYDPATLDLSGVIFGTTPASDVLAQLIQGGGTVCGSLDVTGAPITVEECVVCDADAGTLTADQSSVCLFLGTTQVGATPNGDIVVPAGYEVVYALTQGAGLVVVDVNGGPVFTVSTPGSYIIHTIVYDPATLNIGAIEPGVTTGFDIFTLFIQGGGDICGWIDVVGAPITVNDCSPVNDDCINALPLPVNAVADCPANALSGNNTFADTDGAVPTCDASGNTLLDVWYAFNAGENTSVTITLDQGTMEDWAVVVSDGCGGNELLCALQPAAPIVFTTSPFTDYVVQVYSNYGVGNGGEFSICISGDVPTLVCDGGLVETSEGDFSVDVCQDVDADIIDFITSSTSAENYSFFLTDDNDVIIAQLVGGSLDFNSAPLGAYRVWGISYNGTLVGADPGSTITDVDATGTCADLSDNYVLVNVEICDGVQEISWGSWTIFPNPGNGDFSLNGLVTDGLISVDVLDMNGRLVFAERRAMVIGHSQSFSLAGLLARGVYTVRVADATGTAMLRLVVQ